MEDENVPEPSAPPRRKSIRAVKVRSVEVINNFNQNEKTTSVKPPPRVISEQHSSPSSSTTNHSISTKKPSVKSPPAKPPPPKVGQPKTRPPVKPAPPKVETPPAKPPTPKVQSSPQKPPPPKNHPKLPSPLNRSSPESKNKVKPIRPPIPQLPASKEMSSTMITPKPSPRPRVERPVPARRNRNSDTLQQEEEKAHSVSPELQKSNKQNGLIHEKKESGCDKQKSGNKAGAYENVSMCREEKKNAYENVNVKLQSSPMKTNAIISNVYNDEEKENSIITNLEDCVINIPSKSGNTSRPFIFHQCNSGKEISDILNDTKNPSKCSPPNPTPLVSYSKLRPQEEISDNETNYSNIKINNNYTNVRETQNDLPENIYSAPTSTDSNDIYSEPPSNPRIVKDKTVSVTSGDSIYSEPPSNPKELLGRSHSDMSSVQSESIYSQPPSNPVTTKFRTLSNTTFRSSLRDSTASAKSFSIGEEDYSVPSPVTDDDGTYSVPSTIAAQTNRFVPAKPGEDSYVAMGGDERPLSEYQEVDSNDNVYASVNSLLPNILGSRREEVLTSDSDSESEVESSSEDDEHGFKAKSKLFHVAYEILSTEKSFVEALSLICEDFGVPLKVALEKNPRLLPDGGYNQIFMNVELIYELDKKFLHDLEERMENWEQHKRIGDLVREYGHYLKMYTTYIKGYDNAMSMYHECISTNMRFSQLVKDFEKQKKAKNLKLTSYLLKPIQRIPSYRLLLKDYLKHLPEDSIDYNDIKDGVAIVTEVANYINESMREGEKFQEVLRIQSQIVNANDIIKPGRFLLKEGILQKLSRKELQERTFILFTDALLYCLNVSQGQLKLIAELPLAGMTIQYPDSQELSNEFSVISTKRSFLLNAGSPKEREDWVAALEDAVSVVNAKIGTFTLKKDINETVQENITDLGNIAPPWIPDSRVTMCQICTELFNVYNRRHHCRGCGKVVCRKCSNFEAPLKYMENEVARVCEICYKSLLGKVQKNDDEILAKFKETKSKKNLKKRVEGLPSTLTEVTAQEEGIENSGFLRLKTGTKKEKRCWFVLKKHVLYLYKASSDPAASKTIPILGYELDITGNWDEDDFGFQLKHHGVKDALAFRAENRSSAERWVHSFCKAIALLET